MEQMVSVALVTGAARGIGRAIALVLARPRLTLYLNDIALGEEAVRTQQEVNDKGAQAKLIEFNVADAGQVQQGVDEILKESGRLDLLV
ncbi:MAG: SDR family NAD(P)-dependent oxidoreductase, partial [Desulfobaccales bacterium]